MVVSRLCAKPFVYLFGLVLFAGLLFSGASSVEAALSLTSGSNATTTPNVATSITGFQIVGPSASTTPVKLLASEGTLNLSTISGVTMSGNDSGTVNLSGTVEDLNTALSTLTYTRSSTGSDTLEVSLVEAGEVFFPDNGHLYEYIATSGTWNESETRAQSVTRYGASGYLTTILTSSENSFVAARLGGDGWMGASDVETEGDWKWVTGPESGTSFWSGLSAESGGSVVGGNYANWNPGEPNDSSGEDCAQFYSTGDQSGKWNDLPCTGNTLPGYVAEFGAEEALDIVATNISIVTADVPAVTTFSPANGATSISTTTSLVVGFSKSVTADTGNILIKKDADDSIVQTIDVTSDKISGGGTDSITINPSDELDEGVKYYVTIPDTAFKDTSDNFFEGVSLSTTWTFTTADERSPNISAVTASSTASTTEAIEWTTNEIASSKVTYGLTSSYSTTTSEANISPRVTSHTVNLGDLLSCTLYHYAVVSTDGFSNTATSTDDTFITTGCEADTVPTSATSTDITSSAGGSTSVTENGKTLTVTAPADATATSSSFVIQVKAVPKAPVLSVLGRPSPTPNEVGGTVFDVKAIIDGGTILDSFAEEVTIEYEYTDDEVSNLDESSLWLYHYTGGQWVALNSCTMDTTANTISCTTPSFSIFGLFGSETEVEDSSGGSGGGSSSGVTRFGCKDPEASNYEYFSAHKEELCEYNSPEQTVVSVADLVNKNRNLFIQAYNADITLPAIVLNVLGLEPAVTEVRDLEYGMEGRDVRALQILLLGEGYDIPAGPTDYFGRQTQYALDAYQVDNGIAPRGGYFGPITRLQMKTSELNDLWW